MPRKLAPTYTAPARKPRLSRQERKTQTRASLIEAGRRHILREGLGNAAAERIAEEAGFSRGAFYGNFTDKEDLFLTIVRDDQEKRFSLFRTILESNDSLESLLKRLREALADRVTDPEWIILEAEFEAGALRSEKIRQTYIELYRSMLRDGRRILKKLAQQPGIQFALPPNEFLMAMLGFAHGMAVNQRLLGSEISVKGTRKLIGSVFDRLLTTK
jgi:AcrR family transcriptional regulator